MTVARQSPLRSLVDLEGCQDGVIETNSTEMSLRPELIESGLALWSPIAVLLEWRLGTVTVERSLHMDEHVGRVRAVGLRSESRQGAPPEGDPVVVTREAAIDHYGALLEGAHIRNGIEALLSPPPRRFIAS